MALPERVIASCSPLLIIALAGVALPYEYQADIAIFCLTALFGIGLTEYLRFKRILALFNADMDQDEVDQYFE